MKKIMFNDKYRLTEAVLEGRKTMTRRITPYDLHKFDMKEDLLKFSRYNVGDIVAIAQSYEKIAKKDFAEKQLKKDGLVISVSTKKSFPNSK